MHFYTDKIRFSILICVTQKAKMVDGLGVEGLVLVLYRMDASEMCGAGKAKRAERSGLPRFFFGYFLCSNDKESNNKKMNYLSSPNPLQRGIQTKSIHMHV